MCRRMIIGGQLYSIVTRMEEGVPMLPTANMNVIINGVLARAQELYPVTLIGYVFMANHLHMVPIAWDPEDLVAFVGYIKAEISHAINRMLGRRQRSLWVKGFDCPIILDPERFIEVMSYLYANPAEAGLVDSISEYPGVSSWSAFAKGKTERDCFKVARDKIIPLSSNVLTIGEQRNIAKHYYKVATRIKLHVEPDAWIQCFEEGSIDLDEANKEIKRRVAELEAKYKAKRESQGKKAIGAHRLKLQSIARKHIPTKFGPKMICLGSSKSIRAPFIKFFKEQCVIAKGVYQAWKLGDFSQKMPPGMFAPRPPNLVCCISI